MTPNQERDIILSQLIAARASIDAALSLLGVEQAAEPEEVNCDHPEHQRQVVPGATMGNVQFQCKACGAVIDSKGV
ncbi:MAG: hypothetical protein Q8R92_17600 [Deltaproteobacteria bacterium]|nr:hypothetical protein [Deltaproteobacteria bacterium]